MPSDTSVLENRRRAGDDGDATAPPRSAIIHSGTAVVFGLTQADGAQSLARVVTILDNFSGHFLSVLDHRQATTDLAWQLWFAHAGLLVAETRSVNDVRQF
jgi:hypothetical protein